MLWAFSFLRFYRVLHKSCAGVRAAQGPRLPGTHPNFAPGTVPDKRFCIALLYQKTPRFVKGFCSESCTYFQTRCVHFDHNDEPGRFLCVLQYGLWDSVPDGGIFARERQPPGRLFFLLPTKERTKENCRCCDAADPRLRGCTPLRTPIRKSEGAVAKRTQYYCPFLTPPPLPPL